MSHMSSPSRPPTATPTPPPAPPPTPASTRKRKTSEVDEAFSHSPTNARATADPLRKYRERDDLRTTQLKFIMQEGERKGARARSENEERARAMEITRVPVHIRFENCAIERQPGNKPRLGKVKRSSTLDASIWTLHAPFLGHEGSTFEQLRSRLRVVYLEEFADSHRGHKHPSQKDGDILMDGIRFKLSESDLGMTVNEQNWQTVLALLVTQQLPCSHMGKVLGKACIATFVARFSCPRST